MNQIVVASIRKTFFNTLAYTDESARSRAGSSTWMALFDPHGIALADHVGVVATANANQGRLRAVVFLELDSGFHGILIPGIYDILQAVLRQWPRPAREWSIPRQPLFCGCKNFQFAPPVHSVYWLSDILNFSITKARNQENTKENTRIESYEMNFFALLRPKRCYS
jgi:hypothetical protein